LDEARRVTSDADAFLAALDAELLTAAAATAPHSRRRAPHR
jgi:hypothetical protein